MARTMQEISQEFTNLCAKAGQIGYQIHALNKDLELVNNTLRDLNLEAAEVKRKEEEASKETSA